MVCTPTKSTSRTFTDEHVTSAAGAAQQLDHALDIDAAWEGEKSRIILDYYRNILIDYELTLPHNGFEMFKFGRTLPALLLSSLKIRFQSSFDPRFCQ